MVGFDCGIKNMNAWLLQTARKWQRGGGCQVMVLADEQRQVKAFYALSAGQISRERAPKPMQRNAPDPLPVVVMGRLAVSLDCQGKSVATSLMLDAFDRVLAVRETIGVTALMVHALSEDVVPFYEKFGFQLAPAEGSHLLLFKRVKDMAAEVASR